MGMLAKWRARRDRRRVVRMAEQLRSTAAAMDAMMLEMGLSRQRRREIYRSAASAQSFSEAFRVITPSVVRRGEREKAKS